MDSKSDFADEGRFDIADFVDELAAAPDNHNLGTTLWFENNRVRVWEILLAPGERGPFHSHITNYFWTVVEGGRGLQRFADGSYAVKDYEIGETKYLEHTTSTPLVHDLENIGGTVLRFVTVEILD